MAMQNACHACSFRGLTIDMKQMKETVSQHCQVICAIVNITISTVNSINLVVFSSQHTHMART